MKAKFEAGKVIVEYTREDYNTLMMICGAAAAGADPQLQHMAIQFAVDLNRQCDTGSS